MKTLQCPNCGSDDLKSVDNYFVCRYCGSRILPSEEEQKILFKNNGSSTEHSAVNSGIGLENDIAGLLKKCEADPGHAKQYANLILDMDPCNEEALKYL